ncbi:retrovirus-related pol polyprotein from transposon TNT 1-94 [Tanacetum coccineum]
MVKLFNPPPSIPQLASKARFTNISTSLKALDESFSSHNHVKKFLRALPTKWRPKDSKISKSKKEKYKSLALIARKVSSDEEVSCSESEYEEYAMAVRDFKKFFGRRGKFVRQTHDDKKNVRKIKEYKKEKEDRRFFKCGDPNHFISDCPKHSYNDQNAFIVGCWSDSEEDSKKEEICLMALDNNEKDPSSKRCPIISIRTNHGREFDNEVQFEAFCDANGITHNFSAPRTPQSNGIVESKNYTLQEMSRTMLNEQSIPQKFWCNPVDTFTYILNRILIIPFLKKTPYELFKGKNPSLEYFKVFGSKYFIINTKDYLTKFDPKSTEGVFLGYSPNNKAYIILNKETMRIEESLNVRFDKSPPLKSSPHVDDDIIESQIIENQIEDIEIKENEPLNKDILNIKESKDHPIDLVIEPKNVKEAIHDESWTMAMQEELNQFKTNNVWILVPPPDNQTIIGTNWVFKNKLDENGVVSRNKARLVAQGYNQQEGIYFDETYALVARLESIRILLSYACVNDFKLFQMDVKSAFLNGFINKEV